MKYRQARAIPHAHFKGACTLHTNEERGHLKILEFKNICDANILNTTVGSLSGIFSPDRDNF
jgi:hypothetical protein